MLHQQVKTISFTATAPSNIAFLKYWGKKDAELQWPANDSLSMTLQKCATTTTVSRSQEQYDTFQLNGITITSQLDKNHKVFRHLDRMRRGLGSHGHLKVTSTNSFPQNCGIASSASGFCALTLASAAALLGTSDWDELAAMGATREKLAQLARMGSGSACRSMYGGFVGWYAGQSPDTQQIHQLWSPDHWQLADIILLVETKPKEVPSSQAHLAAWSSPLFQPRLAGLQERSKAIINSIKNRDLELLGRELESEALEMHAICMTGTPPVNYLSDITLKLLSWIRLERQCGRLAAWATIDAGPNIHLICHKENAASVARMIRENWSDVSIINDEIGSGPTFIANKEDNHYV